MTYGGINMIDTHAHLTDADFDADRAEVIERAKEAGVEKIICILCEFNEKNLAIFKELLSRDFIFGAAAIHPHDAKDFENRKSEFLKTLGFPKLVAVGEIGLDYHYMYSPKEIQVKVFEEQLLIAKEKNLPVVIHSREAPADTLDIIKKQKPRRGVMHCFSGDEKEAKEYLGLGFYISFAGPLTFRNAAKPKEVIKMIPDNRLLLETDCPWLAPQAFRGKRNEPAYIKSTYEEAARLRNTTVEKLSDTVTTNTKELFNI